MESEQSELSANVPFPDVPFPDEKYEIGGYVFESLCGACPDDYDVRDPATGEVVGYARLRWGRFRVYCPDHGGDLVLEHQMEDEFQGLFGHGEREAALAQAAGAIREHGGKQA